jgi:hypothetical protein
MDKHRQALIAINEAIQALGYLPHDIDLGLCAGLDEAMEWLLGTRSQLTDKDFPKLPNPYDHPHALAHWFAKHEADQKADGRL